MTSGYLDPATRRRVEHELDELRIEFRGVLAAERYIVESRASHRIGERRHTSDGSVRLRRWDSTETWRQEASDQGPPDISPCCVHGGGQVDRRVMARQGQ